MTKYQFKTDRRKQWELLEARDVKEGRPAKYIEKDKKLFFGDKSQVSGNIHHNLIYWPDRTIEGWQDLLDNYTTLKLSEHEAVNHVQKPILQGFSTFFQEAEDDAYFVRECWGEEWHPGLAFKLRLQLESPPLRPLDANEVFFTTGASLRQWLVKEDRDAVGGGYIRLMPDFFESLIPHVDLRAFDINKYQLREYISQDIQVPIRGMKVVVETIIEYAHLAISGDEFVDQRSRVARQFYNILNNYRSQLGDFPLLEAKVIENLEADLE